MRGYILTQLSSISCWTFFCAASLIAVGDDEKNLRMKDMKCCGMLRLLERESRSRAGRSSRGFYTIMAVETVQSEHGR